MAIKMEKVSDIDGAAGADYDVVVRGFPGVEAAKLLNVTKEQAQALLALAVKDAITIEVRMPDTSVQAVQIPKADFAKWVGKPDVVQKAANLKGRRPGYSPNNGN